MGTAIGFECDAGAVLAADRVVTRGGSVVSRSTEKLFAFDDVGAAVVGERRGIDAFQREFDSELRSYRTERGEPTLDALVRTASRIAAEVDVEVLLVARDDDRRPRLHTVSSDGSVLADAYDAIGSGAQLALGRLERIERDVDPATAAATAEDVLATVSERDPGTGDEIDVWQLAPGTDS